MRIKVSALRKRGIHVDTTEQTVEMDPAELNRLIANKHPAKRFDWPPWALEMKQRRHDDDRGVGDTVEKEVGLFGSPEFKAWFARTLPHQKLCPNCPRVWNRKYPYH